MFSQDFSASSCNFMLGFQWLIRVSAIAHHDWQLAFGFFSHFLNLFKQREARLSRSSKTWEFFSVAVEAVVSASSKVSVQIVFWKASAQPGFGRVE
jgi:hypothetical protein